MFIDFRTHACRVAAFALLYTACRLSAAEAAPARLSVDEIVALARSRHPISRIVAASRQAGEAEIAQAKAWQNPELDLEAGRARARDGDESSTVGSIALRQPLEWPSQRSRRIEAARRADAAFQSEAAIASLDFEAEVRETALIYWHGQEAVALAQGASESLRKASAPVSRRVAAGEAGKADLLRVQVDDARAAQALDERRHDLSSAAAALAVFCGALPEPTTIVPPSAGTLPGTSLDAERAALRSHPRLIHDAAVQAQRQAEMRREQAARAPEFSLGVSADRDFDTTGLGVALGIEVPLWNRNRGGIDAAAAALTRAQAEAEIARRDVARAATQAWNDHDSAVGRERQYRAVIQPAAHETLRLVLAAYEQGESHILEVLDARRTAAEVDEQTLDARLQVALSEVRLRRAIGTFTAGAQP